MELWEKVKCWFSKNKKIILISGAVVLAVAGTVVTYVLCKDKKMSFEDWLKIATDEELDEAYENLRTTEFMETGTKSYTMEQIGKEMSNRTPANPPHPDPNYRWTDEARWDKD